MTIGFAFLVILMIVEKYTTQRKGEKAKRVAETLEVAEVDEMIRCVKERREVEGNYDLLHRAQGGVRMLIGASFTVLSTPQDRHSMAKYILDKEVEIHKSKRKALRCLRSKGWSQKETYEVLEHMESPNCMKKAKHQVIDRPKAWFLATCGGLTTILPVLKVSAYVFDFAKDVALLTGVNIGSQ